VAEGMRQDKRIGKYAFLDAGVGYGGSCFPKDVKALIQIAQENGIRFSILEAVEATNEAQKQSLLVKIQSLLGEDLHKKKIAIWGLAFKPQTDDIREAPSLVLLKQLKDRDAEVLVYDPVAKMEGLDTKSDFYEVIKDAECLVIVTEWPEFKNADLNKLKSLMKSPNIVDGRNVFEKKDMEKAGFNYIAVGR
jgi:UDPglucose 6-dehydrogenase